mmetsp:Transcript_24084/g.52455  ORF Transcript_24084/g.52455 Transcript_24084/m.52455 type:complete len:251 (+) Transcript_24084:673-1425(+)
MPQSALLHTTHQAPVDWHHMQHRHQKRRIDTTHRWGKNCIQHVVEAVNVDKRTATNFWKLNILSRPPREVVRSRGDVEISVTCFRDKGNILLQKVALPATLPEASLGLLNDLPEACRLLSRGQPIQLGHDDAKLCHPKGMKHPRVLTRAAFRYASSRAAQGPSECVICGNQQQGCICQRRSSDHVGDVALVPWDVYERVSPVLCDEFLHLTNHGTAHLSLLRPGVQEDLNICGFLNTSRWGKETTSHWRP